MTRNSTHRVISRPSAEWAGHDSSVILIITFCLFLASTLLQRSHASDIVVVCPDGFRTSMQRWIDHRHRDGLTTTTIASSSDCESLRRKIAQAATAQTRYVVLVGDTPVIGSSCNPRFETPTSYHATTVTAAWGSTPTLSSDLSFGDLNADGIPNAVVGRLPVNNVAELDNLVNRIIAYETTPDFGLWRGNVQLVGGVGGFGGLIDTAIESVARTMVTGVLPAETRTFVSYASPNHPFFPKNQPFTEAVLADYERGARFWVYAGHGFVTELDRVPATAAGRPVLDVQSVKRLRRPASSSPIALLLACFTGAIDAREDCLAERMLLTDGGPIAVFAGSRVTMPYGNATATIGLIDAIYHQKMRRLGDAWLQTQLDMQRDTENPADKLDTNRSTARLMIDGLATMISPSGTKLVDERCEHTKLYNLLGDPTLHLNPPLSLSIDVASGFDPGQLISVDAVSPIDGELTLLLHRPLGSVPDDEADPNETTVASLTQKIVANQPTVNEIRVPAMLSGPLTVRAFVNGTTAWATAAAKTRIRAVR
ncbi:hypothetical protein Q31b_16210 [Novipirellula aureliae]|uniref:Gingipain domain-containing protein n=1 Tax=Novipirellula aureliae TaxID=2527966 RepID=A0A5C6E9E9_9BACT|nr:C25 family cysteine peptidase [Novipirellula aureliae]TWU44086.1 hypothetical protein Q31b_16210 [Novipirellula aureliae]